MNFIEELTKQFMIKHKQIDRIVGDVSLDLFRVNYDKMPDKLRNMIENAYNSETISITENLSIELGRRPPLNFRRMPPKR